MKLTSAEILNYIKPMLATLAKKDVDDPEVAACANAIVEMVEQNDKA
jgi:hypothetical protein